MSARRPHAALVLAALLAPLGFAPAPARAAAPTTTITVSAAASLSEAFGELATLFHRRHPDLAVRLDLAGSQQIAARLAQGQIADVFASADERWMQDVVAKGLTADAPRPFARNRLVAIVPATDPARIRTLADLARGGVKLVIAADAVPVGRYARQALVNLGRLPGYPPDYAKRTLANVVSEEDNVKAVVGKVRLGEADAGIAYRTDVTPAIARFVRALEIPAEANVVATYPIATLKASPHPDAARAFVDLVLSSEGQAVLARHGFERP